MVCIRLLIPLGLAFVAILHGCVDTTPGRDISYGDSLVILTYHAPIGINPLTSLSGISAMLTDVIFDGILRIDERMEARPALASSWQVSDDGLRWTFFLRKGVRFHDGVELTSEDVKFTLEEIIRSIPINPFVGGIANVKSIQLKDKYTVEITLNRPSIFFLYNMDVGILPSHILKKKISRDKFGLHPVGTGPFRLSQWKGNEIIFKANKDYFKGRPHLESIIVRIYPNQEQAWVRLMREEGDMFGPFSPGLHDFLRQVSSLQIYKNHRLYYSMIALNNESELFKDKTVRLALNYAIDKEYILEEVLKGKGTVASGPIWDGSWAYNPSVKPYPYAPKKALSLLGEVGWRDTDGDHILDKKGKRFTFALFINEGDEIKERAAMYIQQQLWELGILMNIRTFSVASMDFVYQGRYDALYIDIFSHIHPDINYNMWHSSQRRKGFNISNYRSDIVDELLEEGRLSKDIEKARPIYHRFQEEIHNNPPGIFLYWPDYLIGIHRRFRGVRFPPRRLMAYINAWYVPEREQKYKR